MLFPAPFWQDATGTLYHGDALSVIHTLRPATAHCIVTSPPYWGQRCYGDEPGQLGREPTVQEYVSRLVDILSEIRWVLRPDGAMWLVLGDTYATGAGGARKAGGGKQGAAWDDWTAPSLRGWCQPNRLARCGVPPGNLAGVPWRVALALQDRGWVLRQAVVWSKSNARPESVRNRPMTRHEYVFLLTRHQGDYFWDHLAAREARAHHSVWTLPVAHSTGEHPATFPLELAHRCLSATVSAGGCCARCGTPLRRQTRAERQPQSDGRLTEVLASERRTRDRARPQGRGYRGRLHLVHEGWIPCPCGADSPPERCVVLDPFMGAGTTAAAAERLGHRWIGIEIAGKYLDTLLRNVRQPYLGLTAP